MSSISPAAGASNPAFAPLSFSTLRGRGGEPANSPLSPVITNLGRRGRETNDSLGGILGRETNARIQVDAFVAQAVAQSVQAAPPSPGPSAPSRSNLLSRLSALDSKLAQGIVVLLDFLRRQDPSASEALERSLAAALDGIEQANRDGRDVAASLARAGSPMGTGLVRSQRIEVAIEATVTDLSARLQDGQTITAQWVQVRFRANLQSLLGESDPLLLDLDGDGFETTRPEDGVDFDLLGTGTMVRASTATGGDRFLALDRDGNGVITSGRELFGDQNGAPGGFAELARFDQNADGRIDANDDVFSQLRLFADLNRDGLGQKNELEALSTFSVAAILLDGRASAESSNGNRVARTGTFVRADGTTGRVGDLLLDYLR